MEKIKLDNHKVPRDIYFVEKSFKDDENKCIHMPVKMEKREGVVDANINIEDVEDEIHKKYSDINFTGGWSSLSGENGVEEYIFFYQ